MAIRESSEEQLAALLLVLGNIYVGNVKVYEGSRELRRCKNSTVSLAGRDEHEAEKTTGRTVIRLYSNRRGSFPAI